MAPLLSIQGLTIRRDDGTGSAIFSNVSFDVEEGDVVIIRGRSGAGKTTLLKCIAQLAVYQAGSVELRGEKPEQVAGGIPTFRTKVLYLPQRPSLLPGSPTSFLETVKTFRSRSAASSSSSTSSWLPSFLQRKQAVALPENGDDEADVLDPYVLASEWDVPRMLWERNWGGAPASFRCHLSPARILTVFLAELRSLGR